MVHCGQTELPDRSVLIGQKLVKNVKIENLKCDILGDLQTLFVGCHVTMLTSQSGNPPSML